MATKSQTLRELLAETARRFEKKIFLEPDGERYSFRFVDQETDRIATGLSRLGVRPGDRIALLLTDGPGLVFFFLGAAKIGMVPVPIRPSGPFEEILSAASCAEARVLVTESPRVDLARRLAEATGISVRILADRSATEAETFLRLTEVPTLGFWPELSEEDTATIAFTRGTSLGKAKAVELSHRNLVSNARQIVSPFRVDETDRFYSALPLASVAGQVLLLVCWSAGASCVLGNSDSGRGVIGELSDRRITVVVGEPDFFSELVDRDHAGGCDVSSLRLAICHSGPVPAGVLERFEKIFDAFLIESYGLAEGTFMTCANPYTGVRKPGSIGLPLPGQECRVVVGSERDGGSGESGEITVRGPNVMKGYYRGPEQTARVLREGWLHTGDYAYKDSDGYYYLTGRKI